MDVLGSYLKHARDPRGEAVQKCFLFFFPRISRLQIRAREVKKSEKERYKLSRELNDLSQNANRLSRDHGVLRRE